MAAQVGIAGSTHVGSHCMIGGQVGLAGHIKVGDNVEIGAQSGVHANLRDGARVLGTPATGVGEYARINVYLKRLADLFDRVKALEKSQADKSENK